jgi:hypothetical protein
MDVCCLEARNLFVHSLPSYHAQVPSLCLLGTLCEDFGDCSHSMSIVPVFLNGLFYSFIILLSLDSAFFCIWYLGKSIKFTLINVDTTQ